VAIEVQKGHALKALENEDAQSRVQRLVGKGYCPGLNDPKMVGKRTGFGQRDVFRIS
jgi:hypothetical protein